MQRKKEIYLIPSLVCLLNRFKVFSFCEKHSVKDTIHNECHSLLLHGNEFNPVLEMTKYVLLIFIN